METFLYPWRTKNVEVQMRIFSYPHGNLAATLYQKHSETGEFDVYYASVTAGVSDALPLFHAAVDLKEEPMMGRFLERNGLAQQTGRFAEGWSGIYPVFSFNKEALVLIDPTGTSRYTAKFDEAQR